MVNKLQPRRFAIKRMGQVATGLAVLSTVSSSARADTAGGIRQPVEPSPARFMERAYEMKRQAVESGDQAYGAVVVKDGRIVGQAPSRVVTGRDPTAHAETEAIRDAARRLGTRDLSGCTMYSTSPPCAMCETAAYWAGIERLVAGRADSDRGAPRYGGWG